MNSSSNPKDIDKARDYWLDPGDEFADIIHSDDCEEDECEGECIDFEPDYESMIQDRIEYETDRWLDDNGY
jgi:hypothetical protein